ncbi:hydrolase [Frondihabitans sucicola]|uniref:Hydrolase n=1 Tax=Frondihabitans sucicola TaxID=1268041 RepID=A0ABM8GII2_9MICO|nr:alpha/beta fold hydrolase [Frondihabitans sucicola]BDZ48192.1 hydrolase [Frondihabitans sucicola]
MAETDYNGGSFYYEVDGDPAHPAIVLIHAGVANLRMWDRIVPELATDHRILRYDTRGFGRTETGDVHFSEVDDLLAVMDQAGVERATLIGASRGGRIAIDATVEHPERVAGLVTIGSNPSGFPEVELTERENDLFDELDALLAAGEHEKLNRLETELWAAGPTRDVIELDPAFLSLAYELNAANVRHIDDAATPVPLESPAYYRTVDIEVPALFAVGEHDLSSELAATEYLLSTVPDSDGARFPDSAHLPSVERPEEFVRVLTGWLTAHSL